ncbi:MAG: hypothetical protein LBM59_07000 [Ruminococcus sp.]|nr:hypothetical protein [Ruminococcus sp.]
MEKEKAYGSHRIALCFSTVWKGRIGAGCERRGGMVGRFAGRALPVALCRSRFAVRALPFALCRSRFAGRALPVALCRGGTGAGWAFIFIF